MVEQTNEGVGIDDIHIFEKQAIYTGPSVNSVSQNVNGNGWTNFIADGKRLVSINPHGQDLGSTEVQVHIKTAGVTGCIQPISPGS